MRWKQKVCGTGFGFKYVTLAWKSFLSVTRTRLFTFGRSWLHSDFNGFSLARLMEPAWWRQRPLIILCWNRRKFDLLLLVMGSFGETASLFDSSNSHHRFCEPFSTWMAGIWKVGESLSRLSCFLKIKAHPAGSPVRYETAEQMKARFLRTRQI